MKASFLITILLISSSIFASELVLEVGESMSFKIIGCKNGEAQAIKSNKNKIEAECQPIACSVDNHGLNGSKREKTDKVTVVNFSTSKIIKVIPVKLKGMSEIHQKLKDLINEGTCSEAIIHRVSGKWEYPQY